MDLQNGLPNPLATELQHQGLVQPDVFTVDSQKQQPISLFSIDEQLIKETLNQASQWKIVAEPFSNSFGEGGVNSWANSANAPDPITSSNAALLNSLLPKPQTSAAVSIAQYPVETIALSKAVAVSQIQEFLNRPDYLEQFKLAFGQDVQRTKLDQILQDWQADGSKLPQVSILSAQILGKASGGFDTVNNQVYLSSNLIERGKLSEIVPVIIEEFGHYLDSKIHPNGDAIGDEGEIFSKLVRGISISASEYVTLINEDDHATIILNNSPTVIEQAVSTAYAIKAEKTVSFNGSSDLDGNPLDLSDDALVYGGKGFTFNGNSILPVKYDASGNPIKNSHGKLVLVDKAVTVAAGYLQANVNGTGTKYAGLIPPQIVTAETVVVPLFADIKQQELNRKIPAGTTTTTFNISTNPINTAAQWATKFPPAGTATVPKVVRVTGGGLNIPGTVNLSNYVIIVDSGDINFNGTGSLSNVTLVASNGNINLNSIQSDNLSVLASGTINHNSGARFGGNSLFANGTGNITFNGATKGITANDNLWVISAGNITFNGSQSTRGSFVAQGDFTANGSTNLYGTVSSKQNIIFNGALNFTYANIRNYSDNNSPVILASLVNDSGTSNSDKITNDSRISGTVTDASQIVAFKAGFDSKPVANFTDVLPYLTNGSFSFTKAQLETIYGSTIPDGIHTLNLIATDQYGNQSGVYPYTFTLDTTIPVPTLNLTPGSDTGVVGDFRTLSALVTLTGKTEANARVLLSGNPTAVTADSLGNYTFANVAVTAGNNSFTVTATDIAGNQKTYTQIVYRTSPPTGVNLGTPQILENSANNTVVGGLNTSDLDGVDNYVYTLVNDAGGRFKLVGDKIQVANGSLLDFEATTEHQIQVRTTDGEGDSYLQTMTISVLNVNESPNNLLVLPTVILENSPNNTIVGQITTTDPDAGDSFSYSLVAGSGDGDNPKFAIAGDKLVIKNLPDFETQSSYTIRLKTTDAGGLTFEKQVTISVSNINEAPTSLTLSNSTVAENIGVNGVIGIFTSTDPDIGDTRTYTLTNGIGDVDNNQFTIVGDKLQLNLNPNFEAKSTYQLRARVTDIGGLSYEKSFTVNISDVNEAPTNITIDTSTLNENIPANSILGNLSTIDPDLIDTASYTLVTGTGDTDNSKFAISGNKLTINQSPDFETQSSYSIRIKTTDKGGLTYEKQLTIGVNNVNEAPTSLTLSNNSITENIGVNGVIGTFTSIDPDLGDTRTYTLTNGLGDIDNSQFTIVGDKLQLKPNPDFETKSSYQLRARVTDAGGLSYEQSFTVNISDVNEAPTALNISNTTLAENVPDDTVVGNLTAIDPDITDTQTFSLIAGTGDTNNSAFNIVGTQLIINNSPDFEAQNNYSLRVRVSDGGGLTFDRVININITDVNEAPTGINLSGNNIAENSSDNSTIGILTTLDPDPIDSASYTLTDDANGRFKLVGNELKVANGSLLDFEANIQHQITIVSTDNGGLTFSRQFAIGVTNVNEIPIDFSLSNNTVAENTPSGGVIGNLNTIDPDFGDTHTYTLVNGVGSSDNSAFSIVNNQLRFLVSPNFETKSNYSLRVSTTDAGGLNIEKTLTVNITNVNEAPTQLVLDTTSVAENSPIGTLVGKFTSTDPDLGDSHSYSLVTGNGSGDNPKFLIVNNELRLNISPDFETQSVYYVRVQTADAEGLTWEQELTVNILDLVENQAPTAIGLTNSSIAENSANNTLVARLNTTDPNAADTHTYLLLDNAGGRFKLVGDELRVANGSLLDFGTATSHQIRIRTTDNGTPNLAYERDLMIGVTNVNETPLFTSTPVLFANAGKPYSYTITTIDPDTGDTRQISTNQPLPSWLQLINNGDGTATLSGNPGTSDIGIFNIGLTVTDAAGLKSTQTFNLGVTTTLVEGTSFNKHLDIPVTIPATGGKISFKLNPLQFDGTDLNEINDALEVALVDAQGKSVVTPFQTGQDAFFNWTEGEPVAMGKGASYDPATGIVTLDLTGVTPGAANLVFRLINNDKDTTTTVTLTDLTLSPNSANPPVNPNSQFSILNSQLISPTFFNTATDVSPSILADYHRTSFNAATKELDVNVALKNQGSYGLNGTLVVVVNHISDPSASIKNADGFTPEGLAYYTFTTVNGKLDPSSVTGEKTLVFRNPNGVQFSYDLTVLAELNAAPVIKSLPGLEVIGGEQYQYQIQAEDLNGDSLTYKLLTAPSGMSNGLPSAPAIDPSTGLVNWNTSVGEVGNYQLAVEVSDGRGGITQQNYNLAVITPPPNRPPVFTSNPVVDANINTPYIYQITAKDLDGDSLTYSIVNAPNGMTVASDGKVNWTPTLEYLGSTVVTIKVEDSQGGFALQEFKILTNPTPGNQAPIFTSAPVTLFNLAATINAAKGNVNRQVIDLELPIGAVATQNISITLPSDGTSGADIVFVVDESGSMGDARAWISNMVLDLDQALNTAGITANRYAFVGYGAAAIGVNFSPEEQTQVYTIEGKAGETLYFDLEPDQVAGFSWTLYGANRQVVKSGSSDVEVTLSSDGKYSLLIQNTATSSKAYRYKIVNSQPTVKPLNLSELTSGKIQVMGEQNKYVFSGKMGDKIYFDGISSNIGNSIVASLKTDENISIFADILLANNSNSFILPKTGGYILTVDGQNDAIGDYNFRLSQENNTAILDLNNNQINLTLDPKKSIVYNFDGSKGQRLSFDSLSNVAGVWKLIGPSNQQINATTNLNADFSVTLSADGNYWLLLEPTNTTPVNYSFKVQSNQEAALVTSGFNSLHTGLLNPGQQQIHTFTASGGTLVYLDNQDLTTGTISIQLKDANGTLVSTITNTSDSGVINLSRSGEYSLIVKNTSTSATSDYAFQMLDLTNGEVAERNISIFGSLTVNNGAKIYTFNATKGEHLYIDGLSGNSSIVRRLISPSGAILINNTAINLNSGIINIAETGTYSLLVTSSNAPTLEYSFQILDERNILPLNGVNAGSLEAGKSLVYKFTSEQGQILYLNSLKTATANWKVVNANGQTVKTGSLGTDIELPFSHRNDYWLVLENTSTLPVEYSFAATTSQANALPIGFNNIITGQINVAGQKNIYTFNGNAGQNIYYDGISSNNSANLKITLTSPDGTVIINANAINSNSSSLVLAETGIYTLTVDALSDLVGNYSFQLLDSSKTLSLDGSTISQTLNVGESLAYSFDGSKGQRLSFDSLSNVAGVWKLIGPSNQQINATTNTVIADFSVTLSADGHYWLLLEPANTTPVNYSFKVQSTQEAALTNSGFNSLHTGLLNPGQQQIHTFTASGGTLVYLDNQDLTTGSISIQLKDANGTLVSTITNTSDSGVITLSRSGEYSLIVKNASTSATSDYAFQMLDLANGENLSINSTIISSLPVKTATKLYTFNGNTGQNIYFDNLVNNSTINVRLITPSGYSLINNLSLATDRGTINLTETGTYSLLIGASNATSLDYGFRLLDYGNPILFNTPYKLPIDQNNLFTTPLGIGQIVSAPNLSSGFEDGYEAIQTSLNLLPFRAESAANIILISDEDRDILDSTLNFGNTLAALTQKGVRLNGVINGNFASSTSQAALGMSPDGTVYLADGSGGFSAGTGGLFVSASENTKRDYIDLIWANGGTAWSIGQFRGAGTNQALNATSFTKAFVDANTDAIAQQLSVNLTTANTSGGFSNLTGIVGGVAGGQTANFTAQFTGTGQAQVYDLLFQRPDTGVVLGSVPVVVNGAYTYDAQAIDPDGDVLTYKLVNAPTGAKIDAQTGLIRWLPTKIGSYEFIVATSDGRGGTAQQTYQLAVTELPNQLPVITSIPPTQATANQPLSYQVIATDADANVLSYVVDAAPLGLTINRASGLISWTPTVQQVGQHPVSVRVLDGRGGETTQQINLTVLADSTNRAPSFTSTAQNRVEIGASYQYQVTATDADGDALTYESKLLPQGMRFDAASQTLVWQPGWEQLGKHQVVLKVADGRGGVELQTFEIAVTTPNVAPEIVSASLTTAVANTPYQTEIRATDADGKVVAYRLDQAPAGMMINAQGVINWQPPITAVGTQAIKVTVVDDGGLISTQTYNLDVLATRTNQAPVITSTPRISTPSGQLYVYDLVATDSDNNPLTYSLINPPAGMTLQDGIISWTPNPNQFGAHEVIISVSDGNLTATQTYQLDVTNLLVNQSPEITSRPSFVTSLDRPYIYQLSGIDRDNDTLIWSLDSAPTGMVIDANTGILKWNPTSTQLGTHTVAVRLTDAYGLYVGQEYILKVNGVNTPPQIQSTPNTIGSLNSPYKYQVKAVDTEGDTLKYTLGRRPVGMVVNSDTGLITWTPNTTQLGNQTIDVLVTDAQGATSTQTYNLVVGNTPINQAPTITSQPKFTADINSQYQYQVVANDPENSQITYALTTAPNGMVIDASTGLITWDNPTLGNTNIQITATDVSGAVANQGYTLIGKQNHAPVINSTPKTQVTIGNTYRYDVIAQDPDNDALTYRLDTAATTAGVTIDKLGRITWKPTTPNIGIQPVTITVTDTIGAAITQTYNLEVLADNLAPVINLVRGTNIANIGETISFQVQATDNIGIKSKQLLINNQAVTLDSNGVGTYKVTTAGIVTATAIVTDINGNTSTATTTTNIIDPSDIEAPNIKLDLSGIVNGIITGRTDINGTVTDTNLDYYTLEVARFGTNNWQEVFRGTGNVTNGSLGKFDPSLLENDTYRVRLTAYDTGGRGSQIEDEIEVTGDLKLGNFRLSFTDLIIPVTGIPISLTRTYDSLTAGTTDDFGYGWRMEFRDTDLRTSLKADPYYEQLDYRTVGFNFGTRIYITLPGGKREGFTFEPKQIQGAVGGVLGGRLFYPSFVSDKGVTSTLTVPGADIKANTNVYSANAGTSSGNPNGVLLYKEGKLFNLAGRPYVPQDDGFGNRYLLTTKDGTQYEINATTGDLESVTDTNGNVLTYSDTEIKSSTGVKVTFERDNQGRITSVTDPLGQKVRYVYDAKGDLVSVTDRDGNTTGFQYNATRSHYLDKIVDPLGREAVKTEYDEAGRLKKTANASGNGVELVYNPENSLQTVEDALGNPTTFEYDKRGNVVTEVDAAGKITKSTYDDDNNMLSETVISDRSGAAGFTTTYTYDRQQNKLSETDALGHTTYYTYGEKGRLLSTTNAIGNTTNYSYDGRGNLLSKKDALKNTTTYSYDSRGNLLSIVEPNNRIGTFEYDRFGNRTKEIDALGHIKEYGYDANGNVTTLTSYLTTVDGIQTNVAKKTYNGKNQVTSVTDAQDHITKFEYNLNGNQTAIVDALNRRTEYLYDNNNQLIETIFPDDTPDNASDNVRMKTSYDAANNKTEITDPLSRTTKFKYDVLNRGTEVIYPDSTPNDLTDNQRITNQYNQLGELVASTNNLGVTTSYQYDALGRTTLVRNIYNGRNVDTTMAYDAIGRKMSTTDTYGRTTKYVYDALNRVTETIYADETSNKVSYDAFNNVLTNTDQAGKIIRYEYDALNQMTVVVNPLAYRTEYQYNELGNLIYQKDANEHITRYEYDTLGHQIAVIRPMGQRETIVYDTVGRISSVTDFNGQIANYQYDKYDHLTRKSFVQTGKTVDLKFSPSGKIERVTDDNGTIFYTYNLDERLTSQVNPDGKNIYYTYDSKGQLAAVTTSSGTVNYSYDQLARLSTVVSADGTTEYLYNDVGNLITTKFANGIVENRTYDLLNRLTSVTNLNSAGTTISSYSYVLDTLGNKTKITELSGRQVEYSYDALMRLTSEKITVPLNGTRTIDYIYDAVGNRMSRNDTTGGLTTYLYDNNDRLTTESAQGVNTIYTYDLNGNNIKILSPTQETNYSWSQENRLTKIDTQNALGVQHIEYKYDFNGNRIATITDGQETRYLVDTNRYYGQVLEEYQAGGQTQTSYVYGLDLISEHRNSAVFYLKDGFSGVRQLTNSSGQVTDTYTYDAYGRLLSSSGSTDNNYGYQSQQTDDSSGLQYLRARYYDPNLGRFASVDPREGSLDSPVSRHRYLYANDNPVTFFDPTGEYSDVLAASWISSILDSIAVPAIGANVLNAAITVSGAFTAISVASAAYSIWRNMNRGVFWNGKYRLDKIPAYGVPGTPSYALGTGKFETTVELQKYRATVVSGGQSFTIGDLNPIKVPSSSTYEVEMVSPESKWAFVGPFIFTNLKFTLPNFWDEGWPIQDNANGILILGQSVGSVYKAKALPSTLYEYLKYDPLERGFIFGASAGYIAPI